MLTLVLVIVMISVLILVHEFGHFYSARKLGVKVEEFGFGFPPRIFSRIKNNVRYSFNLFPLGGFVKIFGEQGEGEGSQESFISRPVWQRAIILSAGVLMNLAAAWALFTAGAFIGLPDIADDTDSMIPIRIIAVMPGSPAEQAGLKFGDQILQLNGPEVSLRAESEDEIRDFIYAYRGEEITIAVARGGENLEIKAIPRGHTPEGEGPLGIAMARLVVTRSPWYRAPLDGLRTLGLAVGATAQGLFSLLKELVIERDVRVPVSGPVGIFFFAAETSALGIAYVLQFVGLLSVNLAVLNFLPIPALDGGRVLFLAIEKIKGSRVNPKIEQTLHTAGFALLVLLMVLITYRDIARIL